MFQGFKPALTCRLCHKPNPKSVVMIVVVSQQRRRLKSFEAHEVDLFFKLDSLVITSKFTLQQSCVTKLPKVRLLCF